jgi:hypothetical protein
MSKNLNIKFEDETEFERIKNEKNRRGLSWRGRLSNGGKTSSASEGDT